MEKKSENVIKYYLICHRLKDTIRTGWGVWNVRRERLETVAEHIYATQMLAIAMKSEFGYDVDLQKVIFMLAIHELGETVVGDMTQFDISREEKERREHDAVHRVLENLIGHEQLEQLFLEFDAHETPESTFAYLCDKLECDIQCKIYDEENCVNLDDQEGNYILKNPRVAELLKECGSWSEMWLKFDQENIAFDDNFRSVSDYLMTHQITKKHQNNAS